MTSSFSFHHSPSDQRYDAIVIGAGLSGLTAAAYLAQAGARVLVCEQTEQISGLFNSFERNGYQFDSGIKAVENSAVMLPMLAQLGLLVADFRPFRLVVHLSQCSQANLLRRLCSSQGEKKGWIDEALS
jgi:phytoene dehydrogenase-like protein